MKTLITLLIGFTMAASAQPRRGPWTVLGEAHVDGGIDHDRIMVTAARGEYRAIRLRVENAPVQFDRVVVHFGNGSMERMDVRTRVRAGGESRVIDLPGARRVIESVELWYQKPPMSRNPARPKVILFGMR
jgi:hypothetical protein